MTGHTVRAAGAAALALFVAGLGSAMAGEPTPWQMGLQDAASPVKEQLESFHDLLLVIITLITLFVLGLIIYVCVRFRAGANPTPSRTSHNTLIEVVWTVVPVIILIVIAVPSFRVLYFMERTPEAEMTLKVIGRQWYWDYEYPDHGGIAFSSYMLADDQLKPGQPRLLEVDNRVVLPVDTTVRNPGDRRRRAAFLGDAGLRHQEGRRAGPHQRDLGADRARGRVLRPVFGDLRRQPRLHADRGGSGLQGEVRRVDGEGEGRLRPRRRSKGGRRRGRRGPVTPAIATDPRSRPKTHSRRLRNDRP